MTLDDLRQATRSLVQTPTFSLVAIASLAIGIGANTALFSFLHAMVLAPLPYPSSERLVLLQESAEGNETGGSPQRWRDWAAEKEVFSALTAWYGETLTLSGGERAEKVDALRTFGDLEAVFALPPLVGRSLNAEESTGAVPAALLTRSFWRRQFAGDPAVVGRTLVLNGRSVPVVGVLDGDLGSGRIDAVVPETNQRMPRSASFLRQVARLREGVSLEQANERLAVVAEGLQRQYPEDDRGLAVRLVPYRDALGREARGPLLALLGCVSFVLLSACLNLASLLLQRVRRRGGELAVRLALGAGRWRLARLLLAEGLLLAALGGGLGLALASWGIQLLKGLAPTNLPRLDEVQMSAPTVAFALAVSLLTAVVSSLAPAWRSGRFAPQQILKTASPRLGGGHQRTSNALVVTQIAISLSLLFGAGLLVRSFAELTRRPLGFAAEARRLVAFELPIGWETPDRQVQEFQASVLEVLRGVPGFSAAEITDRLPLEGETESGDLRIDGRPLESLPPGAQLGQRQVSLGYLSLIGVPLLAGRPLAATDLTGPRVALLNQSAARLYFPDENPLGARLGLAFGKREPNYFQVVGVVGDLPNEAAESRAQPAIYTPIERGFWPIATFVVETSLPPASAQTAARAALARRFPDRVMEDFRSLPEVVASAVAQPRITAWLVAAFAVAALLLAATGLYGLLSNAVTERRFELGVRQAVGAGRAEIHRLIFGSALPLVALGLALGAAGCWAVQRAVQGLLFGVSPFDPLAIASAACLLAATALLATSLPARAAGQTDPAVVLRGE